MASPPARQHKRPKLIPGTLQQQTRPWVQIHRITQRQNEPKPKEVLCASTPGTVRKMTCVAETRVSLSHSLGRHSQRGQTRPPHASQLLLGRLAQAPLDCQHASIDSCRHYRIWWSRLTDTCKAQQSAQRERALDMSCFCDQPPRRMKMVLPNQKQGRHAGAECALSLLYHVKIVLLAFTQAPTPGL